MADKKISKIERIARDGAFKEQFGSEWFIKIKPAYGTKGKGIDKVEFSFVKKDTAGKECFDIYMDIDAFDIWADDILSGQFKRVIESEAQAGEKYPKEYKYVTGANGEKSVGFMLSTRSGGPVINGSVKAEGQKAVFANVPLSYGWLKTVAKQFKRTSAARFAELDELLMTAATAYSHTVTDADEEFGSEQAEPEPVKAETKAPVKAEPKAPVKTGAKAESKPAATCAKMPEQPKVDAGGLPEAEPLVFGSETEEEKPDVSGIASGARLDITPFWAVSRGSKVTKRGSATVVRAITEKLADGEQGVLDGEPGWQACEIVFYPKNLERAGWEEDLKNLTASLGAKQKMKMPKMSVTVADVQNGIRQLIFQSA